MLVGSEVDNRYIFVGRGGAPAPSQPTDTPSASPPSLIRKEEEQEKNKKGEKEEYENEVHFISF